MAGPPLARDAAFVKRFYARAIATPQNGITLDGRPVRTPGRNLLAVPNATLAAAIAGEWNRQGERIDPRSMPLTGLANAAVDRIAPDPEGFALGLAAYGESDLLCYRAENPPELVARQASLWDPILGWARSRFDIDIVVAGGIAHQPQPPATVERLRRATLSHGPWELAALSPLVTISGSLMIALALADRVIDLDAGWRAGVLDEMWQIEKWGEDEEAVAALAARRRDFAAAHQFLGLLG